MTDVTDDADSSTERYCPFELPEEEYGDLMFGRRLATEGTESVTSGRAESRRGSTTIDTDGNCSLRRGLTGIVRPTNALGLTRSSLLPCTISWAKEYSRRSPRRARVHAHQTTG